MKLLVQIPLMALCLNLPMASPQKSDSFRLDKPKTRKAVLKKDSTEAHESRYPLIFSIITNKY